MKIITKEYINNIKHGGFKSFLKKALEIGVQVHIFPNEPLLVRISLGKDIIFCKKGSVPVQGQLGRMYVNKELTKTILNAVGIQVPRGIKALSYKDALKKIYKEKLVFPFIVKPLDGSLARGVSWNIRTHNDLQRAILYLKQKESHLGASKYFLIEEMFIGSEYRVLLLDGRVISCVQKVPATIVGDGKSTIQERVHLFNKKRSIGFKMVIDSVVHDTLQKNNLTLKSVLPKGSVLRLRNNLNMSDGGRSIERTGNMHPRFKEICEKALQFLGINYGGVDLLTNDITQGWSPYVILEVNANPFYNMHEKPLVEGCGVDVSEKILKYLFPKL